MGDTEDRGADRSARELLEELAGAMRFTSGKVRLSAEFSGGHLIRPMRVASFRVPSGAIDGIRYEPPQIDGVQAVLEEVARQLGPNVDKITAEYSLDQRGADLQWLDVEWAV